MVGSGSSVARVVALLDAPPGDVVSEAVGVTVVCADRVGGFLEAVSVRPWVAAILGLDHPDVDLELVERITALPGAGALFLTSRDRSVERIVASERAGVAGLLEHPPSPGLLRAEVGPLVRERASVEVPRRATPTPTDGDPVVGSSPGLMDVFRVVARVAPTPATVLVTGESGTGKELVARALHRQSGRSEGPFVPINCAAIPDALLEAELFGHEKGAFTGAVAASEGRFARANGGTLFLDEIGDLSLPMQAKLLRVLESREVERVGGRAPVPVDVRIVAATNHRLRARVETGEFREDLLFRLAVVEVELPPLRERPGDLVPLALHFAAELGHRYGRPVRGLSAEAVDKLAAHTWPGNVRELRNVMDRATLVARGGVIRAADLRLGPDSPSLAPAQGSPFGGYPPTLSLDAIEGDHIRRVLAYTDGHRGDAADILGIHRNTLTAKLRAYGIDSS